MSKSNTQTTALRMDVETIDRIKRIAELRQRTPDWVMTQAICQYLAREEKRDVVRRDAVDSWEAYDATGLHVTGDEIVSWLETWGDENEQPAPTCHK